MARLVVGRFGSVMITLVAVYVLVKWGIPAASRQITSLPFPLTVPGTLILMYMTLIVVGLYMFVTFSDDYLEEFMVPVKRFLRGEYGNLPRAVVLAVIPLIVGWQVYAITAPKVELPLSLRVQHPSSNFPSSFANLENPFENPSDADIEAFIEQARAQEVSALIPQVRTDLQFWMDENPGSHWLGAIGTEPIQRFLAELDTGVVARETAAAAFREITLFEGRALHAMNCRPCHGDSAAGDGPLADGFKLRPIDFTDVGTIETIVEGYTFWRISTGGLALPTEATPWDSAMPEWQLNLTEAERWKILMAEYDLAEKTPRILESE